MSTDDCHSNEQQQQQEQKTQSLNEDDDDNTTTITIEVEKSKFFRANLALFEGDILSTSTTESKTIKRGDKCQLHVRSVHDINVLFQALVPKSILDDNNKSKKTPWLGHDELEITVRILQTNDTKTNKKGVKLLECYEYLTILNNSKNEALVLKQQHDKRERHLIFADWLVQKYGAAFLSSGSGVLDVAGGKGELSSVFHLMNIPSVVLDPDPRFAGRNSPGFHIIAEPLCGDGSNLTESIEHQEHAHLITNCSIIVGMHPDQATEAIVDTALRLGKPFAILPCCVMPKLFPNRRHDDGERVRTYSEFCRYLRFCKGGVLKSVLFEVELLPFFGRNKVIYLVNNNYEPLVCQVIK